MKRKFLLNAVLGISVEVLYALSIMLAAYLICAAFYLRQWF